MAVLVDHSGMPLGQRPPGPREVDAQLRFRAVLREGAPATPPTWDFTFGMPIGWDALGNNSWGCCALAAAGHYLMAWSNSHGGLVHNGANCILQMYHETEGFAWTHATDFGSNGLRVLSQWRKVGMPLIAYAPPPLVVPTIDPATGKQAVDPATGKPLTHQVQQAPPYVVQSRDRIRAYMGFGYGGWRDHALVAQAGYMTGGLMIGMSMPLAWQKMAVWDAPTPAQAAAGGSWRYASWGGHEVYVVAINDVGPVVITWGNKKQMTWAGFDYALNECSVAVSENWVDPVTLRAPSGLDMDAIDAYLATVGTPVVS